MKVKCRSLVDWFVVLSLASVLGAWFSCGPSPPDRRHTCDSPPDPPGCSRGLRFSISGDRRFCQLLEIVDWPHKPKSWRTERLNSLNLKFQISNYKYIYDNKPCEYHPGFCVCILGRTNNQNFNTIGRISTLMYSVYVEKFWPFLALLWKNFEPPFFTMSLQFTEVWKQPFMPSSCGLLRRYGRGFQPLLSQVTFWSVEKHLLALSVVIGEVMMNSFQKYLRQVIVHKQLKEVHGTMTEFLLAVKTVKLRSKTFEIRGRGSQKKKKKESITHNASN